MLGFEEVKSAGFGAQPSQAIRAVPARSTSSEPNTGFPANVGVSSVGFSFNGNFHPARNAIDVLRQVFEALIQNDSSFPERFAGLPKHGNKRRYLARDANALYPGRPDLCRDSAIQLTSGWWLGTNHSRQTIGRIIEMARNAARAECGKDLVAHLG